MRVEQVCLMIVAATLMCGCHMFRSKTAACNKPQEYQRAQQVPPLKVPAGLDSPNTQGALVIPGAADLTAAPRGPRDACLDTPPKYKAAPPNKAASG